MERPLDNGRRAMLATECNVFHLYTMHILMAMASLDNAHRYSLRVDQTFDTDSVSAKIVVHLLYTYRGKKAHATKTVSYISIMGRDPAVMSGYQHAADLVTRLAQSCKNAHGGE